MRVVILVALLLAGCAHGPEPEVRTVEVLTPIRAACVPAHFPGAAASYPDDALPRGDGAAAERYQRIAAANEARKARLALVEPVVSACR